LGISKDSIVLAVDVYWTIDVGLGRWVVNVNTRAWRVVRFFFEREGVFFFYLPVKLIPLVALSATSSSAVLILSCSNAKQASICASLTSSSPLSGCIHTGHVVFSVGSSSSDASSVVASRRRRARRRFRRLMMDVRVWDAVEGVVVGFGRRAKVAERVERARRAERRLRGVSILFLVKKKKKKKKPKFFEY
jgi:hypothetical protein